MNSLKQMISGFLSPLPATTANKGKQPLASPATPSGISNRTANSSAENVIRSLNFSKQGGKRKSLKRKNKKTYKAKRR